MEIKEFAPVYIPTLNRYEHFKRCLDSLERCTWADQTDVYIGLDYPPSEKYVEGWKMIDQYLTEKEKNNGFRNFYVRRREHNCGVGGPTSNGALLLQEIKPKYYAYISSEDDNEFSPNFLEYVNKGLTLYENNKDIILISGYSYPAVKDMDFPNNVLAAKIGAAWGTGHWTNKPAPHQIVGATIYRDSVLDSWKKSFRLYCLRPISLNTFLSMKFRNKTYGDCLYSASFVLEGKYCVFPKISKVRNWGHDGSGIHCDVTDAYAQQEIDTGNSFDYDDIVYFNNLPSRQYAKGSILNYTAKFAVSILVAVRYFVYRFFHKDIFFFYFERKGKL